MADEPDNLVLELLRGLRGQMGDLRTELKRDIGELRSELKADINSLRADVASDLLTMQAKSDAEHKATRGLIDGLRRQVFEYHSSVIGHGMLISELEARVRRVEEHLDLPPIGAN